VLSQCELYNPSKDPSSYILCPHYDGTAKSADTRTSASAAAGAALPVWARHHALPRDADAHCRALPNCVTCLHSSVACVWCGGAGCRDACDSPVAKVGHWWNYFINNFNN
jgi:hypothetical protein